MNLKCDWRGCTEQATVSYTGREFDPPNDHNRWYMHACNDPVHQAHAQIRFREPYTVQENKEYSTSPTKR